MTTNTVSFDDLLAQKLKDPEYRKAYEEAGKEMYEEELDLATNHIRALISLRDDDGPECQALSLKRVLTDIINKLGITPLP
jgi:hypothetical protein